MNFQTFWKDTTSKQVCTRTAMSTAGPINAP